MSRKIQILILLSLFGSFSLHGSPSSKSCKLAFVELDKPFLKKLDAELELNMQAYLMSDKQAWVRVQELMLRNYDQKTITDYIKVISRFEGFETMPSIAEAASSGVRTKEQLVDFIQQSEAFPAFKTLLVKALFFDSQFNLATTGSGLRVIDIFKKEMAESEKAKVEAERIANDLAKNEQVVEAVRTKTEDTKRVEEIRKVTASNFKALDSLLPGLHNNLLKTLEVKNMAGLQRKIINKPNSHEKIFNIFTQWMINHGIYNAALLKEGKDPYDTALSFLGTYTKAFSSKNPFWKSMYVTYELAIEAGVFSRERRDALINAMTKQSTAEILRKNADSFAGQIMIRTANKAAVVYVPEGVLVSVLKTLLEIPEISSLNKLKKATTVLSFGELDKVFGKMQIVFARNGYEFPMSTFRFSILSEAMISYVNKNETLKENREYIEALGKLDVLLSLEKTLSEPADGKYH